MSQLPDRLPPELQRALGAEITARGFPPIRHPGQCGDALQALERHRKHETTCLLKIALMKLSPPRGGGHDARSVRPPGAMSVRPPLTPVQPRGGAEGDGAPAGAVAPRTVALDIETTGLDRVRDAVTVVCLYGHLGATGGPSSLTLNFLAGEPEAKAAQLGAILDAAPRISCFNGTRFDLPFLQERLGFAPARVGAWVLKMFDVFDIASGILRTTFRLDVVLALNGMPTKSASGLQAVAWARRPEDWPLLEAYCLEDTRLTFELSQLPRIRLPPPQPGVAAYHVVQDGPHISLETGR